MSRALYQVVEQEEKLKLFYKSGRKRPRRSGLHADIYQCLIHLAVKRHDVLKIFVGADKARKKQHTAHIYAERSKMKITTVVRDGWLFIRQKESFWVKAPVPSTKMVPPAFLVTTAAEMRQQRRKA
jgi:hypothetical protein